MPVSPEMVLNLTEEEQVTEGTLEDITNAALMTWDGVGQLNVELPSDTCIRIVQSLAISYAYVAFSVWVTYGPPPVLHFELAPTE